MSNKERYLHFYDKVKCNNKTYFSSKYYNALFCVQETMDTVEFVARFINEAPYATELHRQIFAVGETLYFIPYRSHGIHEYNTITGEQIYYPLTEEDGIICARAFLIENEIWMVPNNVKVPLFVFHTQSKNISQYDMWETIKDCYEQVENVYLSMYGCDIRDGILWMVPFATNTIIKYHIYRQEVSLEQLPETYSLGNFLLDEDKVWFVQKFSSNVISWNTNTKEIVEYAGDNCDVVNANYTVVKASGRYFVLGGQRDDLFEVDMNKRCLQSKKNMFSENFARINFNGNFFVGYSVEENRLYLLPNVTNGTLNYDLENERISYCPHIANENFTEIYLEIAKQHMSMRVEKGWLLREKEYATSADKLLQVAAMLKTEINAEKALCGNKIWETLRD